MKAFRCALSLLCIAFSVACLAQSRSSQKKHLLVIGEEKGCRHESVSHAMTTIERLGKQSGLWDTTIRTDTEALTKKRLEFNAKNLTNFDAVFFFAGGDLEMDDQQKVDLLSYVHDDSKGFIGVHSAAITLTKWPEFVDKVGGTIDEHPWGPSTHRISSRKVKACGHCCIPGNFGVFYDELRRQNFPGLVAVEYEKEGDVNQDLAQEVAFARKLA